MVWTAEVPSPCRRFADSADRHAARDYVAAMHRGVGRSALRALVAGAALLVVGALGGCDEYQDAEKPSEPRPTSDVSPPPDPVSLGGLRVRPPAGFVWYDVRDGEFAQLIPDSDGAVDERQTLNLYLVRTVVGDDGAFVPADDQVLAFLRAATARYRIEDLGTLRVSGREVPVVRISTPAGGVAFCASETTEEADSCVGTGDPGNAYAFVPTTGGRTVVVERADLRHLRQWQGRLTLDPTT